MKTEDSKIKKMYGETFDRVRTPEGVRSRILNTHVDAAAAESHVSSRTGSRTAARGCAWGTGRCRSRGSAP